MTRYQEAKSCAAKVGSELGSRCYPHTFLLQVCYLDTRFAWAVKVLGTRRAEAIADDSYTVAKIAAQEAAQDEVM